MTSQNPVGTDLHDVLHLGTTGGPFGASGTLGASLADIDSEDVTLVSFVLDMSSSMEPLEAAVIAAFNDEVSALAGAKTASAILAAATTFADGPTVLFGYQPLARVPRLSSKTYAPNGSTALYDAVLGVLDRLSAYRKTLSDNGVRSRAVVIVLSDGDDNVSRRSAAEVKLASQRLLRDEAVVLAYAGFGGDALAHKRSADAIGFPHVITSGHSGSDLRRVLGVVSQSVLQTAGGARSGGGFF